MMDESKLDPNTPDDPRNLRDPVFTNISKSIEDDELAAAQSPPPEADPSLESRHPQQILTAAQLLQRICDDDLPLSHEPILMDREYAPCNVNWINNAGVWYHNYLKNMGLSYKQKKFDCNKFILGFMHVSDISISKNPACEATHTVFLCTLEIFRGGVLNGVACPSDQDVIGHACGIVLLDSGDWILYEPQNNQYTKIIRNHKYVDGTLDNIVLHQLLAI